ncbi:glycoside hydrolase family protein [Prevotella illustrans]|uniref:filamentous hemagglutinin n=1 Tax=Prevotella illustrans TaxID=2800387 RepID=UPI001E5BF205|nr:filamentous hemagglutinin [Prevotella illustrans]
MTSGYDYYFEKNAITNSRISGGNKNNLNDDDNNIVVYNYDAPAKKVKIWSHYYDKWDQFKVRDIIVGYVKIPNVRYEKEQYDIYSTLESFFDPNLKREGHVGHIEWELSNPNIVDISGIGCLRPKHLGKASLTATFSAYWECGKVQCKTIVNVIRDRVNFTAKDLPGVLFDTYDLHALIDKKTQSGQGFKWNNPGFSVTSSNSSVLRYDNGKLLLGGTAGEATITLKQEQNDLYEATTFSHTFIVMRRDQNGTILIKDANEWKLFCKLVNEKGMTRLNARLEADIDLGNNSMMVGTNNHKYAGTFDGAGHTLTVHVVGAGQGTAPFHRTDDATIKNLTIAGTVTAPANTDNYHTAGLVGFAESTTLRSCVVKADIHLGKTGDQYSGGLIGHILSGNTTIEDCAFIGSITGDNGNVSNIAGLIAWGDAGTTTISNSYVNATYTKVSGLNPILRRQKGTTNNLNHVYYSEKSKGINPDYNKKGNLGEQVTAEQLRNGEVAYLLQNKRTENVWGQNLGSDDEPLLTADGAKRVYKVDFTFNSQVRATRYATRNKAIYGSMPTVQEILGTGYNPQHYYSGLTFADNFSGSTSVTADKQVAVSFTHKVVCEIASKADWKEFRDLVNGGQTKLNAKMTADVDLGSDIWQVGNHYAGTFDGQGHTLKINWNNTSGWLAPFYTVDGATIKNLRTEGEIKSSSHFLSGLVQSAYGNTTISGCVSAVNITSTYDNGGCDAAGMIECVRDNANVTITDCLVKGKFHATTEGGRRYMSGFVENQYGKCTLTNCLYIGENNATTGGYTFAKKATLTNCYYLNPCSDAQGKKVTEEQLKSGEVAYLLQNKRAGNFWGQELGKENDPQPTDKAEKHVCKVDFSYNDQVKATRYATNGKGIHGGMPTFTAKDLMGSSYNEHHFYTIAFEGDFNGSTTVSSDQTVAVLFNHKEAYEIASKDNWKTFCDLVNDGQAGLDAKMTADVDLGSDIVMVGVTRNYSGTFDGQGHALTVNWNHTSFVNIAPFKTVEGATIKNLHVKGQIEATGNSLLSGLILSASGKISVSGCVIDVDLKGSSYLAGMIHMVNLNTEVIITDCVVKGALNSAKKSIGGFVDYQGGTCTLTNCLYIGKNNATTGSNTFADNATLNNCYYLNTCGKAQGKQVTAERLKSGEMAKLLQGDRTENVWGQTLGTDLEPLPTTDEAKHIYKVAFTYNNEATAARYANKGGTVSLPTLQEALGNSYNPHHYYTGLAFADGFSETTTIDDDKTVAVNVNDKECFDIASKEDWKAFRELVNDGQTGVDARLMQDVDLGEEILMLGYYLPNVYEGTFDGQGHTLSFNWTTPDDEKAPFKNVKDATIRNLHIKGSITLTEKNPGDPQSCGSQAAGLINYAYGNTTVSGCVIDVNLKVGRDLAGILLTPDDTAHITINDCVVKGYFHATDTLEGGTHKIISGFIGHKHKDAACTLNNCLYLGTNNASPKPSTTGFSSFTFCPEQQQNEGTGFMHINNCYYLNPSGKVQGDQITEAQLKNGEVAKLLQADRTDQCYWAQALGEEPSPYREADKAKPNYVYYNKENNGWACDDFRLTDDKPLPIGIDFTAAKVSYERDLSIGKATLCLPYELSVQGFKAYTISGGNNSAVHFADAKDKLEAYKPYLITADGVPQLGGNDIQVKAYKADALTTTAGKYSFVGTVTGVDNATAAAANAYILQNDGLFHKVTTEHPGATVPAYRAYVTCPKGAGAKQLSIVIDGETTGIGGATNDARGRADGPVYDLQGRRVADRLDDAARHRLPAGVYIVGGRKVVVK